MEKRSKELEDLIKSNKVRRETLAQKNGFKTAADYRAHLELNGKKSTVKKKPVKSLEKKVMYNIFILDESGSMGGNYKGSKYLTAKEGIQEEINLLKNETEVDIKFAVVSFDSYVRPLTITSLKDFTFGSFMGGLTALHDATGITLNSLLNIIKPGEKAVVKIFTDGGENASIKYYANDVRDIIKKAEDAGITVTFIGTEMDVRNVTYSYNLRDNNTLSHNNTVQGVKNAFKKMSASTVTYSKSYVAGASDEELLDGFFKQTGKL